MQVDTKNITKSDENLEALLNYYHGDLLPISAWQDKYQLENEATPTDMHIRMAENFARKIKESENIRFIGELSEYGKNGDTLNYDKILSLFKDFKHIIPQGSVMAMLGSGKIGSLSNCFVVGQPSDSYGGVFEKDHQLAQLMKRRGGVGIDISTLRPAGVPVTNAAGTSAGAVSFMDRFSNTTREVAQNGRRGALMITMDCNHPDILDFVNVKKDKSRVTGANISVMLRNEFMEAVKKDEDYILRFPCTENPAYYATKLADAPYNELVIIDGKQFRRIKAKELYASVVENAHDNAEPGQMFVDRHWNYSPDGIYPQYRGVTTNPCIIGDTKIAVADGRNAVSIRRLAEEGKEVPLYSINPKTGKREIKIGRSPRKTKEKTEVWKLSLDDGSQLIATPDHKILTKDLRYIELKDLKSGDSLFPFNSFNSNKYRQICGIGKKMSGGAYRNKRQYREIYEFNNQPVDPKKYAIHHIDYNSQNDSIDNLQTMLHKDHISLHAKNMMGEKNPYHKQTDVWKKNFASHPGESNGKYIDVSNADLLKEGKKIFKQHGKLTQPLWISHAKNNKLPQSLSNNFRFSTFSNFKNQVSTNHKVEKCEFYGYEDVYNITVDDNHNYDIITSWEDDDYIVSSGITVKNCGEIFMQKYDACRLIALNLISMVDNPFTPNAKINYARVYTNSYNQQMLADVLVDLELEHIDRIIDKINSDPESDSVKAGELSLWKNIRDVASSGRRTGSGFTGLADMLAAVSLKYDSIESKATIDAVLKMKMEAELDASIDLAVKFGPFKGWDPTIEYSDISKNGLNVSGNNEFYEMIRVNFPKQFTRMMKYGRRNVSWNTVAPTGTLSMIAKAVEYPNISAGMEPNFMVKYHRNKKINNEDKTTVPDFVDQNGDAWKQYPVMMGAFKDWIKINYNVDPDTITAEQADDYFKRSPWFGACAPDINWKTRVEIQSIIQKYTSHSISSTINLPEDVTVEEVSEIYMHSYEQGLKGVTVYRDGSRTGVLVNDALTDKEGFEYRDSAKRPKCLPVEINSTKCKGTHWNVLVGLYDGKPYEVFAVPYFTDESDLELCKAKRGQYDLMKGDQVFHKDITSVLTDEESALTRMISTSLRHGADITYIVEQLNKSNGDITSFSKAIARTLKRYVNEEKMLSRAQCSECKSTNLRFEEGCMKCIDCGDSKCG